VIWEGEPGDRRTLTYAALDDEVVALARGLRSLGWASAMWLRCTWVGCPRPSWRCSRAPGSALCMPWCRRRCLPRRWPTGCGLSGLRCCSPRTGPGATARCCRSRPGPTKRSALSAASSTPSSCGAPASTSAGSKAIGGITTSCRRTLDRAWCTAYRIAVRDPTGARVAEDLPADHPLVLVSLAHRGGPARDRRLGGRRARHRAGTLHRGGWRWGRCSGVPATNSWLGTQVHGVYGPLAAGETAVVYEGTLDVPTLARAWQLTRSVCRVHPHDDALGAARRCGPGRASWASRRGSASLSARVVSFGEPVDAEIREWAAARVGRAVR
jgi:acetyl-CoA synthetase